MFFPFGTGHRSCIGSQFAMVSQHIGFLNNYVDFMADSSCHYSLAISISVGLHNNYYNYLPMYFACIIIQIETKIILARLLQRYKITLPPDYKVVETQTALAGLQGDLPCTLERRKE